MAETLNVNQIPVREALLQLEAKGVVKFEPHKKALRQCYPSKELSVEQVNELFELRAMIETVRLAKERFN